MQGMPVTSLSGGWKMKLALARAMLMKADILLLDEPTNHLDVKNVAWIENYLISLTNVTSIIVSHDSGLLDHCCSHIIHFENKKLRKYKGNLAEFVKIKPEAKSYYSLKASRQVFRFPEPGFLDGVKSKSKVILRMRGVGFTYPGTTRKIITGASIYCSLQSRVAVLGANGAGKSTMIKILTGELIPDEGEITRHPNLRVAYVAQHAFHHLEQHLNQTPNQYIQWRYAGGEDKEGIQRAARQVSEEEQKVMEKPVMIADDAGVMTKRVAENIIGRRQAKKDYEYEVKWVNRPHDDNTWLGRDKLETMGWKKIVQKVDEKEASRAGAYAKPLTQQEIQKHLENVGLEVEFAVHTQIRALSGGQKVKVVLAAAMWNHPHVLILDEPTNYLDRDSLGALAGAIREFGGGVMMISHHSEFTDELCEETWMVENGHVTPRNQPEEFGGETVEDNRQAEQIDASGNVVKIKIKKELSRKERLAKEKENKRRLAAGEELSDEDD
jgi:elongation factor 3